MVRKLSIVVFLTIAAATLTLPMDFQPLLAAPANVHLDQAPPPPPPTSAPPPSDGTPSSSSHGGGSSSGGGSRFLRCNSTIKGFVTNYADRSPGAGAVVQIGASGWKNETPADSNGHYEFGGLCEGTAYVKVLVPEGGLPTNPDAEAVLDGKNEVAVNLGFFPPAPLDQAVAATQPTVEPLVVATPVPVVLPAVTSVRVPAEAAVVARVPVVAQLPPGLSVQVAAPHAVSIGLAARMTVSVKNGGPDKADGMVITIPVPDNVVLQEVSTSRGQLRVMTPGAALGSSVKLLGHSASDAPTGGLVVEAGNLAAGQGVVIAAQVKFRDEAAVGSTAELRAEVTAGGRSNQSNVVSLALGESGASSEVGLPPTGNNGFAGYYRDLLW
jgi:uncharacterized repeat protein (TIGR01451 family)